MRLVEMCLQAPKLAHKMCVQRIESLIFCDFD